MEKLSNEVILEIFSHLRDPFDILQNKALVCKNWHQLSKHYGAWKSAAVLSNEVMQSQILLILKRAPELKDLYLDLDHEWIANPHLQEVIEASDVRVTGTLTVIGCKPVLETCAPGILQLLSRSYKIHKLRIRLEQAHFDLITSAQENIFTTVNKMKNLRGLMLDLNPLVNCDKPPNFKDLHFELPCLKSLRIDAYSLFPGPMFVETAFSLFRDCHVTLTDVSLIVSEESDLIPNFVKVLEESPNLRTVHVTFDLPRSAPKNWPHLQRIMMDTQERGFSILFPGSARFKERFDS